MGLNGAGTRFISSTVHEAGVPGGCVDITFAVQPLGSYPANGESLVDLGTLAVIGTKGKVAQGAVPDDIFIEACDNLGHVWSYDPAQGLMGTLRNWTTIGATPTEHATDVYTAGELLSLFRLTARFPLVGDMAR